MKMLLYRCRNLEEIAAPTIYIAETCILDGYSTFGSYFQLILCKRNFRNTNNLSLNENWLEMVTVATTSDNNRNDHDNNSFGM